MPRPGVSRSSNKPRNFILLAEYEDAVRARQPSMSAEFREATQGAGSRQREMAQADQLRQVPAKLVHASICYEHALPRTYHPAAQDHVLAA